MLEISEFVTENPKAVKDILISVCNILFGIAPTNINTDLINVSFKTISDKFIGITVQDIRNAYQDAEIDKKAFVSITRDELILPIRQYWSKKITLLSKIKEVEQQVDAENQSNILKERFKMESLQVLNESIEAKIWLGTPVNAFSILSQHKESLNNVITGKFEQSEKDELYQKCLKENNTAKHIELDKCDKKEVNKWLEKLVDPKWIFANELIKLYFERYVNI
jgi:hypothetical protein